MRIITTPQDMHAWSRGVRASGKTIGFVPTMGALHTGHTNLLDTSVKQCDETVLSIFVNAAQFNVAEDFDKYPRTFEKDLELAEAHSVSVVYAPESSTMYPPGFQSFVEPGSASIPMEGAGRPGHFRGVTTVVLKLLNAVQPHTAFFGKKDYQQLAVIKQMVSELDLDIAIEGIDTVRDFDGLALSSRNVRLTAEQRGQSSAIYEGLTALQNAFVSGERSASRLETIFLETLALQDLAKVEYVQVVDQLTLQHHDEIAQSSVACIACWFGDVRLIDNIELNLPV